MRRDENSTAFALALRSRGVRCEQGRRHHSISKRACILPISPSPALFVTPKMLLFVFWAWHVLSTNSRSGSQGPSAIVHARHVSFMFQKAVKTPLITSTPKRELIDFLQLQLSIDTPIMLLLFCLVHALSGNGRPLPGLHLEIRTPVDSCDDINDCRTLFDIVWGCLATIFACTWVSVHPNVPPPNQSRLALFWLRLRIMLAAVITPELIVGFAARQFFAAWWYSKGAHYA